MIWHKWVDARFMKNWRPYVLQSSYAALTILVITVILKLEHVVVIASLGATAFIVFAMPNSVSAQPKRIIGGHILGFISGSIFGIIPDLFPFIDSMVLALAVGVTFLAMVITDTEHPPAAGTAMGMALDGYSQGAMIAILTSVLIYAAIQRFARKYVKDLV